MDYVRGFGAYWWTLCRPTTSRSRKYRGEVREYAGGGAAHALPACYDVIGRKHFLLNAESHVTLCFCGRRADATD